MPSSESTSPTPQQEPRPSTGPRASGPDGPLKEFLNGVRFLGQGLAMWGHSPRLLLIGAIPALIAFVVLGGAFTILAFQVDEIVVLVTPFADGWGTVWRVLTRVVAGIAVLGAGLLLAVLTYTALTLLIGGPFYEKISTRVEQRLGDAPDEPDVAWWRALAREAVDSLRLLVVSVGMSVLLLVAGFIPLAGQTIVPLTGAFVAGWFLALEVVGIPCTRRGIRLAERKRLLAKRRPLALGFGVSTFLLFLIPLGAVLVMPAAVAGGTLMARAVLDTETHTGQGSPADPAH